MATVSATQSEKKSAGPAAVAPSDRLHWYVSSLNGDDAYPGTTRDFPTDSLDDITSAISDGEAHAWERGSEFRSTLDLGGKEQITTTDYGSGKLPVADARDEIPDADWSQTSGTTNGNVYETNPSVDLSAEIGNAPVDNNQIPVYEDDFDWRGGVELEQVADVSTCDSTPGSKVVDLTNNIIYIHPPDSDDPSANTHTYLYAARLTNVNTSALNEYNHTFANIHLKSHIHNDGTIRPGGGATIGSALFEGGQKHNVVLPWGEATDMILWGANSRDAAGNPLVCFHGEPEVKDVTLTRTFINAVGPGGGLGIDNHSSGAGYDTITAKGLYLDALANIGTFGANTVTRIGWHIGPNTARANSVLDGEGHVFRHSQDGPAGGVMTNTIVNPSAAVRGLQGFTGMFDLTECSLVVDDYKVHQDLDAAGDVTANWCLMIANFAVLDGVDALSGDHNVLATLGSSRECQMNYQGATYSTLSGVQSATGSNANSVWLDESKDQYKNFFVGDPNNGDLRINPDAEATDANGNPVTAFPDGESFQKAGQQRHFDWGKVKMVDGTRQRWPDFPETIQEAEEYVKAPGDWTF